MWTLFRPQRATRVGGFLKPDSPRRPWDVTFAILIVAIVSGCAASNPQSSSSSPLTSPISEGSPTSQSSPTPTIVPEATPPVGDACLAGTWTMSLEDNPSGWSFNGQAVHVKGLAGEVLVIRPGGTDSVNWATAKPLVGTFQGRRLTILLRGHAAATVHGAGGLYTVSKISGSLTAAFNWGGTPESSGPVKLVGTGGLPYSCTPTQLVVRYPRSITDTFVRSG
jgi:hypothetical protein